MLAFLLLGFKGVSIVAGTFAVLGAIGGGLLVYKYGAKIEKSAAADLSKAGQAAVSASNKV